jgi:hypothetical protein
MANGGAGAIVVTRNSDDPDIGDLLATASGLDLDGPPIGWKRARWEPVWKGNAHLPGRDVLYEIDREVDRHTTVRPSWLRGLADGDPTRLLVASTIWGFGNFSKGPRFLGRMLGGQRSDSAIPDVLADIVSAAKSGASEGFSALFDARGRSRMSHLGIAFGTKLLHFAGYDSPARPRPLVFDARVWRATRRVRGCPDLPSPTGYVRSDQYDAYCSWAEQVADAAMNGIELATVEYLLFDYGGRVRTRV